MPDGGCHGTAEWIDGEVTDQCPVGWQLDYNSAFEGYNWMEKGVMPSSGGWLDGQPAILLDAMDIIAYEVNEYRRKEADFAKHQQ